MRDYVDSTAQLALHALAPGDPARAPRQRPPTRAQRWGAAAARGGAAVGLAVGIGGGVAAMGLFGLGMLLTFGPLLECLTIGGLAGAAVVALGCLAMMVGAGLLTGCAFGAVMAWHAVTDPMTFGGWPSRELLAVGGMAAAMGAACGLGLAGGTLALSGLTTALAAIGGDGLIAGTSLAAQLGVGCAVMPLGLAMASAGLLAVVVLKHR